MTKPWMKFYPQDWIGDEKLKTCSLAAQGLWMTMLCVMHRAEPRGYFSINGKPATSRHLVSLTGNDESTVSALMSELESAGVYSVNRKGLIYSRRMNDDEKASKEGEKHIGKRWNKPHENKGKIPDPNRGATREPFTQKPEAREKKKEDLIFEGKVIRLTEKDSSALQSSTGLSDKGFQDWIVEKDKYYATLPEHERAGWWMRLNNATKQLRVK